MRTSCHTAQICEGLQAKFESKSRAARAGTIQGFSDTIFGMIYSNRDIKHPRTNLSKLKNKISSIKCRWQIKVCAWLNAWTLNSGGRRLYVTRARIHHLTTNISLSCLHDTRCTKSVDINRNAFTFINAKSVECDITDWKKLHAQPWGSHRYPSDCKSGQNLEFDWDPGFTNQQAIGLTVRH